MSFGYGENIAYFNLHENGRTAIVAMTPASIGDGVISMLSGSLVDGKHKLTVKLHLKKKRRNRKPKDKPGADSAAKKSPRGKSAEASSPAKPSPSTASRRVFVGSNLPEYTNEQHIREHFVKFEKRIENIDLIRDRNTKQFKGFCFVRFSSAASAQAAIRELNHSTLLGMRIRVSLEKSNEKPDKPAKTPLYCLFLVFLEMKSYRSGGW